MPSRETLRNETKMAILICTIIATELGSNAGVYLIVSAWLWLDKILTVEECILDYIDKKIGERDD